MKIFKKFIVPRQENPWEQKGAQQEKRENLNKDPLSKKGIRGIIEVSPPPLDHRKSYRGEGRNKTLGQEENDGQLILSHAFDEGRLKPRQQQTAKAIIGVVVNSKQMRYSPFVEKKYKFKTLDLHCHRFYKLVIK